MGDDWKTGTEQVTLLIGDRSAIADDVFDEIAEEVVQAAFTAAHEGLERVEGFKRWGDLMPDEYMATLRIARLFMLSVLSNGPIEHPEAVEAINRMADQEDEAI